MLVFLEDRRLTQPLEWAQGVLGAGALAISGLCVLPYKRAQVMLYAMCKRGLVD